MERENRKCEISFEIATIIFEIRSLKCCDRYIKKKLDRASVSHFIIHSQKWREPVASGESGSPLYSVWVHAATSKWNDRYISIINCMLILLNLCGKLGASAGYNTECLFIPIILILRALVVNCIHADFSPINTELMIRTIHEYGMYAIVECRRIRNENWNKRERRKERNQRFRLYVQTSRWGYLR